METAYLHLVTNHIPIIGVPFAIAVLVLGIWRKSSDLKAAAFLIFVFLGIATLGVYLLGQSGEDFIEGLPGVSHDAIEDHEGAAKLALLSVGLLGLISLFAFIRYKGLSLFRRRKTADSEGPAAQNEDRFPAWITLGVLILALISSGVLGFTGRLGGKIRHPEFHGGAQPTQQDGKAAEENKEEGDEKGRGRNRGRN
jgi:hypothetical protein